LLLNIGYLVAEVQLMGIFQSCLLPAFSIAMSNYQNIMSFSAYWRPSNG
jgi:hypothetical protein